VTVSNVTPPTISGTAQQGQTLTAGVGTWSFDEDYLTYQYQWLRCDAAGANCVAISGKTSAFLLLTASDVGSTIRVQVTATEHTNPAGGGLSDPYFNEDFVNISTPEWDSVQTYYYAPAGGANPGPPPGVQGDPSGRLSLVTAPDAVGRALRLEIRNGDGKWNNQSPEVTRCQLGAPTTSIWDEPVMTVGDIRYFDMELWIPDEFDYARNTWNALIGIHPSGSTGWGCFNIVVEGHSGNNNAFIDLKLGGGSPPGTTAHLAYYNLIRLTDGSGNIYAPNRNRRIHLRYGARFAPDFSGWAEAWVDGVNVLPRFNHPTCWADDFHQYMKLGPYKLRSASYPSGKTVIYFTRIQIGRTV